MEYLKIGFPIFSYLKNDNQDCYSKIELNKFKIEKYLENEIECKDFVNKLNEVILEKEENFDIIEKVLKHESFSLALYEFKESDILIKACKKENEAVLHWLLTMEINSCVKDSKGMTALMYAAEKPCLLFVVQYLIYNCNVCIDLTDNNEENAIFHAVHNIEAFKAILNTNIDINHLNKQKDTVLLYCCKNDIPEPIKFLSYNTNIDVNIIDEKGRNAAMYLVEKGQYHEFQLLTGRNIDLDYRNEKDETLLSILVNAIYQKNEEDDSKYIIPYLKILMILVQVDCDFNIPIDNEGNTPLMFFIMIEDIYSVYYIITFCHFLNIAMTNNNGESAFSLSVKIGNKSLIEILMNHPTFDFSYTDQNGNNLLMLYSILNNSDIIKKVLERNIDLLNKTNKKGENALIIATKLFCNEVIKTLVEYNINLNQQDEFGNTALHYAVQLNIPKIVNTLAYAHADKYIKNYENQTPYDIAKNNNNEKIIDVLEHPVPFKASKPQKKNKVFSLKKFIKKGSKQKNKDNNNNNTIEYIDLNHCNDIINFDFNNNHKNLYQPMKCTNTLNELEMKTYGFENAIEKRGISKTILRQALALEVITQILDTAGNFF
ncbi:ankyrin [Piromyces finnis]|uniref:Ankyrin n=1 Tax=Piromyces finnis TaxID=1754191 RepID=A0A1Y1V2G7_9FUNG|nr:ankyrin [Piromyces finnis]|eukprot:ORX44870.1 ankyrin [Piromyces finnis]